MFYIKYYWILYIYCTSAGIFSLFLFIHKQCEYAHEWVFYYDFEQYLDKEYDFIVVGGGTAGSLVAGRLAENPDYNVLLIEAGGEPSFIFDIPLLTPFLQQSQLDWKFVTVPQQTACYGMENQLSKWPRGRVLGGSSRLNYMVYLRGHKNDFENWADGYDWSFDDILQYFKKSENQRGIYRNSASFHGTSGPIYVSDQKFQTTLGNNVIDAGKEIGFEQVDLNSMISSPGFMSVQVTGYNGARWSADQMLRKRRSSGYKDNLKILTNAVAQKVLLINGFEANGVQFSRNGRIGDVFARKSVILSAGTIGSAKILLQSGIGPKNHLLEHNITPLVNLPVGENLEDHVTTGLDLVILNETLPLSMDTFITSPMEGFKYFFFGEGLLTHCGVEAIGHFHLEDKLVPDMQLMVMPFGISSDAGAFFKKMLGINEKIWEEYFFPLVGRQVVSIIPKLLHPKSRGFVRLRSSNPEDPPVIDPKYLSHPYDIKILIQGLRFVEKLVKTKSLNKMGAHLYEKPLPGCENFDFGSDSYWECYIRHLTFSVFHPVGTCKMGDDDKSVVDHNLRVHKTNKLHVIDASIMPTIPSANTNAAVMMIAEKGADIIKYLWHINKKKSNFKEIFVPNVITLAK